MQKEDREKTFSKIKPVSYIAPKFDIDHNLECYKKNLTFPPCPFYIRYQREDENDDNSAYFLNDYNMTHSHPLNLKYLYIEKSN